MSRKDYIAIADVINSVDVRENSGDMVKSILVSKLCRVFASDNSNFNSAKFRNACYHQDIYGFRKGEKDE